MKRIICFFLRLTALIFALFVCNVHDCDAQDADTALVRRMDNIDVSLLTCQAHDEVYSLYGHTAIRVNDRNTGEDIAVNYGVFDFNTDYFVLRFVFGLTDYAMGICSYEAFLQEYRHYGSAVYEQRINMSAQEKMRFLVALADNAQPENVIYRYNFFYNNCTTKARDILLDAMDGEVEYKPLTHIQQGRVSFRDLIHMKTADYPWARMGNDLLLGISSDANTSHDERQFLPEVLMCDFDSAHVVTPDGQSKALVDTAYWALQPGTPYHSEYVEMPGTPLQCAWVFFSAILALVIFEAFVIRKSLPWAHYVVYCLYAMVGIGLFLMLFSQHPTVRANLQILIFNPLFFILALPKVFVKWGKYVILICMIVFFLGNMIQHYAEGVNVLALALLLTFCPIYFENSKKSITFAPLNTDISRK